MNTLSLDLIIQLATRSLNLNILIIHDGGQVGTAIREFYSRDPQKMINFLIEQDRADLLVELKPNYWSTLRQSAIVHRSINTLRIFPGPFPVTALAGYVDTRIDDEARFDQAIEFLLEHGALPMPSTIDNAASQGYLNSIKRLVVAGGFLTTTAMAKAARGNHLAVVQYLVEQGVPVDSDTIYAAVTYSNDAIIQYLIVIGVKFDAVALDRAAIAGRAWIVDHIRRTADWPINNGRLLESAAKGGLSELVKELLDRGMSQRAIDQAFLAAVQSGQFPVVKQLFDWSSIGRSRPARTILQQSLLEAIAHEWWQITEYLIERAPSDLNVNNALATAVEYGNYRIIVALWEKFRVQTLTLPTHGLYISDPTLLLVRYLHHQLGMEFDSKFLDSMAIGGHYDIVRYLHDELEVPFGEHALDNAFTNDHRALAQYLLDRGATFTTRAVEVAARSGRLDLVAELLAAGAPIGPGATYAAARGGNLSVLKLLVDHGAKYDPTTLTVAITNNQMDIVEYLVAQGVQPENDLISDVVDLAPGDLTDALEFLYKVGQQPAIDHVIQSAIENYQLDAFEVLHHHGVSFNQSTMADAIKGDRLEIVIYLVSLGVSLPDKAVKLAIETTSNDNVRYVLSLGAPITDTAAITAANLRDINILDTLQRHGADFSAVLTRAIMSGRYNDVEILLKSGVPVTDDDIMIAVTRQNTAILQNIMRLNNDLTGTLISLITQQRLNDIRYLINVGVPITDEVVQAGVNLKSPILIQYFKRFAPMTTIDALTTAIETGQVENIRFLIRVGVMVTEEAIQIARDLDNPAVLDELARFGIIPRSQRSCFGCGGG